MTCSCGKVRTFAKGNDWSEEVLPISGKDSSGKTIFHAGPIMVYWVAVEDSTTPLGGLSLSFSSVGAPPRFYPQFDAGQMDTIIAAAGGTYPFDLWRVISAAGDVRRTRRVRILKSLPDSEG